LHTSISPVRLPAVSNTYSLLSFSLDTKTCALAAAANRLRVARARWVMRTIAFVSLIVVALLRDITDCP